MIITSESDTCKGRKQLLIEQLKDLDLADHTETFEVPAEDKNDPSKKLILISIQVPDSILNQKAEENEIEANLTFNFK